MNNARSKRGDPRKSKRIEDLLRRARNKGHLFKYAEKLRKKLLADEDRHISPNQGSASPSGNHCLAHPPMIARMQGTSRAMARK